MAWNCKIPRKTIEKKLLDISLTNNIFDMTTKPQVTKVKINKLDHIKLKSVCKAKERNWKGMEENIC